jgi:hypothetical protein
MNERGAQEAADAQGLVLRVVLLAPSGETESALSADLWPNTVTIFVRDHTVVRVQPG